MAVAVGIPVPTGVPPRRPWSDESLARRVRQWRVEAGDIGETEESRSPQRLKQRASVDVDVDGDRVVVGGKDDVAGDSATVPHERERDSQVVGRTSDRGKDKLAEFVLERDGAVEGKPAFFADLPACLQHGPGELRRNVVWDSEDLHPVLARL